MDMPNKRYNDWKLLPMRQKRLQELQLQGHAIAIITNQAGVALGHVTKAQAEAKIATVLRLLALSPMPAVYVCYSHKNGRPPWTSPAEVARRKPSGAMLREAMHAYTEQAAAGVWYIGDRLEDEAAAQAAHVPFQWANDFFGTSLCGATRGG